MSDGDTTRQLSLIGEIHDLLAASGIPHWLFGGWAVDFAVGSVTRQHDDIEFLIWREDFARLEQLLVNHDYTQIDHPYPDEDTIWEKYDQKLEFYFLMRNEHGQIVTAGRWQRWPWSETAFLAPSRQIDRVVCPLISAEALLETKEGYRAYTGREPREKDEADVRHLRSLADRRAKAAP